MFQGKLFEIFCDRYPEAYIDTAYSVDDIDSTTVEQVSKDLKFTKMQYRENHTDELITMAPNTIYKKMMEYVPILPQEATISSFYLPSIY